MDKLIRRMVIVFLMAVIFAFATTALVLSKPERQLRFRPGTAIPCFYSANPQCYPVH